MVNNVSNQSRQNRATNPAIVVGTGIACAIGAGIYGASTDKPKIDNQVESLSDARWLNNLRDSFDIQTAKNWAKEGVIEPELYQEMNTFCSKISNTIMTNRIANELKEMSPRPKSYQKAIEKFQQSFITMQEGFLNFGQDLQINLQQYGLFDVNKWNKTMINQDNFVKAQQETIKTALYNHQTNVLKKIAGGAILGLALGFVIDTIIKKTS